MPNEISNDIQNVEAISKINGSDTFILFSVDQNGGIWITNKRTGKPANSVALENTILTYGQAFRRVRAGAVARDMRRRSERVNVNNA